MKINRIILVFTLFLLLIPGVINADSMTIKVKTVDQKDFADMLSSYKGKVVLLNVWATWCKPCREEFPDLIKLADHYKGKDVSILSLSAEDKDDINSKIIPFLKKFNINFPVFVQDFPKADIFIETLHKKWEGALPATFIYDRSGNQKVFFIGKKDFNGFKKEIEKVRNMQTK